MSCVSFLFSNLFIIYFFFLIFCQRFICVLFPFLFHSPCFSYYSFMSLFLSGFLFFSTLSFSLAFPLQSSVSHLTHNCFSTPGCAPVVAASRSRKQICSQALVPLVENIIHTLAQAQLLISMRWITCKKNQTTFPSSVRRIAWVWNRFSFNSQKRSRLFQSLPACCGELELGASDAHGWIFKDIFICI